MTIRAALVSEKGGVGKSAVTLGLASAGWAAGERVLVVDLDPQGSSSRVLGVTEESARGRMQQALDADRPGGAAEALVDSTWGVNVSVLPADRAMRRWENEGGPKTRALRLDRALRGVAEKFDTVLIDCPPGLGAEVTMALSAAQRALMVAEPSMFSVEAIAPVADVIDDVWQKYNPDLDLAGVIVNRVPAISAEADRQFEAIAGVVGRRAIWKPVVPQRVLMSEAAAAHYPIHAYRSRAADLIDAFDRHYRKLKR